MEAEIYIANDHSGGYRSYWLVYPNSDIVIKTFETEAALRRYATKHGYILAEVV